MSNKDDNFSHQKKKFQILKLYFFFKNEETRMKTFISSEAFEKKTES